MLFVCSTKHSVSISLQWRHNGRDAVSNHQTRDCVLSRLIRRRSQETSKLYVTGFNGGIHRWLVNCPHEGPVTRERFPFDDVIMITSRSCSMLARTGPFVKPQQFWNSLGWLVCIVSHDIHEYSKSRSIMLPSLKTKRLMWYTILYLNPFHFTIICSGVKFIVLPVIQCVLL